MNQSKLRQLTDINQNNVSMGMVSGALAFTGPPVIILEASANGHFTIEQTILWMFAVYFFGGLFSIILPLYYKIPITGGHSITGVAFLATVTPQFTYSQLIGAFVISGILIFLVGIFGIFKLLMKYVPKEIIAAMLAGMITSYLVRFIVSIQHLPLVGGAALLGFFLFTKWKNRVPPVIAAVLIGFIVLFISHDFGRMEMTGHFVLPNVQVPSFSLLAFVSVAIPLALLILSNDAAPGVGALEQNDYHPPVNRIISLSGVFSMISAFFGGQSANVAGMMSAICSNDEAGPRKTRYVAAVVSGLMILMFGIFAWKVVPFIQALPRYFVSMLAGFALMGVMGSSLNLAFSKPELRLGTTFAFILALSNISVFYINAPVWSLIGGTLIVRFIENRGRQLNE